LLTNRVGYSIKSYIIIINLPKRAHREVVNTLLDCSWRNKATWNTWCFSNKVAR